MHRLLAAALEAIAGLDVQRQFQLHGFVQGQRHLLQAQHTGDPARQADAQRLAVGDQLRGQGALGAHRDMAAQAFQAKLQVHRAESVAAARDLNLRLLQVFLQGARRRLERGAIGEHVMVSGQCLFVQASQPGQRLVEVDQDIQLAAGQVLQGVAAPGLEITHLPIGVGRLEQGIEQHRLQAIQTTDAQQWIVLPRGGNHAQAIAQ
ncbi:hypothetical protein D9M71_411660 [compost metagenome]